MNFKEVYKKYIIGKATEEEIKYIEDEIEKSELINEYLYQNIEDEYLSKSNLLGDDNKEEIQTNKINSEDNILKQVNKSIKKRLLKTSVFSVIVIITLALVLKYIVSPISDSQYYNPAKKIDEYTENILADVSVFTELHFPGYISGGANAQSLGYGKYDIKITQENTFTNESIFYNGNINKGKLNYLGDDFYKYPITNIFKYGMYPFEPNLNNDDKLEIEELKKLPDTSQANVYVSFEKDVDMKEIEKLINKYDDLYFSWVGIRSCPKDAQQLPLMGFETSATGIIVQAFKDNKNYPYIELGFVDKKDADIYETHFKSLLKYMKNRNQFTKLGHPNVYDGHPYEESLEYVQANGVKSYGVVVSGSCESILKLRQEKNVYSIYIDDIKLSRYSN